MKIGDFLLIEGITRKDLKLFLERNEMSQIQSKDFVTFSKYALFTGFYEIIEMTANGTIKNYALKNSEEKEKISDNCYKSNLVLPNSMEDIVKMVLGGAYVEVNQGKESSMWAILNKSGSANFSNYHLISLNGSNPIFSKKK